MDSTVLITICIIFLTAIISLYLQNRSVDACLKDFEDFQVTLEEKDGDVAWGRLRVYRTGIELEYVSPNYDKDGHIETSYIFYKEQFPSMHAIYRYADDLSGGERKRRNKQLEALVKRPWLTRLGRRIRNGIAMLKDAVMQTIGIAMGQAKKMAPGSVVLRDHEKELQKVSKDIIGHVGNAFEPILEKYIGRRVVLEITREGVTTEQVGILKNYTAEFIEVLDIVRSQRLEVPLRTDSPLPPVARGIVLEVDGIQVKARNVSRTPLYIRAIRWDDEEHAVNVVVQPGLQVDFGLEKAPPDGARAVVEVARKYDIVVPRTHAIIRHCAEMPQENWTQRILQLIKDDEAEQELDRMAEASVENNEQTPVAQTSR